MKYLLPILLILFLDGPLSGAEGNPPVTAKFPPAILMPWEFVGIDTEISVYERRIIDDRKAFKEAAKRIGDLLFEDGKRFSDYAGSLSLPRQLTLNEKRKSQNIMVGTMRNSTSQESLTFQPVICSVANLMVLAMEVAGSETNTLLAVAHTTVERSVWIDLDDRVRLSEVVVPAMEKVLGEVMERVRERGGRPQGSLHAGLSLIKETTRKDNGSSHCLNMLLSGKLASEYVVNRELGNDGLSHIRTILGIDRKMTRASRRVIVNWDIVGKKSFPLNMSMRMRFSESVLGGKIPPDEIAESFAIGGGQRIDIPVSPRLKKFLDQEEGALRQNDKPMIARIYKAWVYLDRGRAYGLNMSDRLYLKLSGDQVIKGHIVGYYGPGLGIKSPRGFPVNEGAIMFVRTGQNLVKVGQEFEFDPTRYPTSWPPQKTPP
ncbi:MAG: hypothetical protein HQK54_09700 [Oligoflexales bacterium]|nr:hypothetical protein [Oligoflexales bacterium]